MSDQDQSPVRPGRTRRRYLWIVLAILLIIAVLVAGAPSLLSTSWARGMALSWVNGSIPGRISVRDLSLSWLGGQSLHDLAVDDPQGRPVLKLNEFTTDMSLLDALRRHLSLGRTVVRGLDANLSFDAQGTSNLAKTLGSTSGGETSQGGGAVFPVTGNMALIDGRVSISAPGIQPVVLDKLSGALDMSAPDAPLELTFGGQSRQGDLTGNITLDGTVEHLFTHGRPSPGSAQVNLNASVDDLPVAALDQLLHGGGVLGAALGDRTSLHVKASGGADRQDIAVDAKAPNAQLKLTGFLAKGRFELASPAELELQLSPALVDALDHSQPGSPGPHLARPVPLHLTIAKLDVPLEKFSLASVALRMGLDARSDVRFTGIKQLGEASVSGLRLVVDSPKLGDDVRIQVNGKPAAGGKAGTLTVDTDVKHLFDKAGKLQPDKMLVKAESSISGIPTSLVDTVMQQNGLLTAAIGPSFAVNLNADTAEDGKMGVTASIDSDRLETGTLSFAVKNQLALSKPAHIRFTLTPDLWQRFTGGGSGYALARPSDWTLDLTSLQMPLPAGPGPALRPAQTRLEGTLGTAALEVDDTRSHQSTHLDDLELSLGGKSLDAIDLHGSARVSQSAGPLTSMDASPLTVQLDARTGLKADASLKAVTSDISLDSTGVKGTVSAVMDEGLTRLTLAKPASLEVTITPAMLAAWQAGSGPKVTLKDKATAQAAIDELVLPLEPFAYDGVSTRGSLQVGTLSLESPGKVSSLIDNTRATFAFGGDKHGHAKLDLKGQVRSGDKRPGDLSLGLTAENLLNAKGELGSDDLSMKLDGQLHQLPVALVDQLMSMDGLVSASLGATANIAVNADLKKMQGPVSLTVDAPNTQADVKAQVGDKGLTLTAPLEAKFEPTPEFGQKVLSKIHPIFETTQRAEQPIRFEIPPEGVLIPLKNYDFSRITIPKMTLDFGKIVLENGWILRGITGLAQQFGKLGDVGRREWVAWFSPGVMALEDGRIVYSKRLDLLLADKLHLATWGSADVGKDRADLTLAFMPDTMKRVFHLTVADNDALRVPIRGALSSPSVDFKGAAADLARLRAQQAASSKSALAGALLGAVTGKVTGSSGPIPEASVDPLPWAEQLEAQDAADTRQDQSEAKQPAQTQSQSKPSAPEKKQTKEEQVIKGLIDIFGKKKN